MAQQTILILDDDLGFSMWLGRALNQAGIRAFPVSQSAEALVIISTGGFPKLDLLIANLQVDGCRQLLDHLASRGENCKVICIGGAGNQVVDGKLRRPRGKTLPSPERYVETVRAVLGC